jgi:hypothetical protein
MVGQAVPRNKYGIEVVYTMTPSYPESPRTLSRIVNGPIAAVEKDLRAELRKTADYRKVMKEFDPAKVLWAWRKPLPESSVIYFKR